MASTITVRQGTKRDLKATSLLYRELDDAHRPLDVALRVRNDAERRRHLESALDSHQRFWVVAELEGRILGFALGGIAPGTPDVLIEAIAVHRDVRRTGLGTRLVEAVERWAARKGARYVELDVYDFNPEARAFYESLGYLTSKRRMRRDPAVDFWALAKKRRH